MKTEREMFEEWYFDKHYAGTTACWLKVFAKFENLKGSEKSYNGEYINDRVLLAYESWKASAQREGYKLVPVEPTMNMCNQLSGNVENAKLIYKALIEAA